MSQFEPVKVLNKILNRLCQIDRFGYFALPVTEAEAPGYYSVIESPMCFSMMREKIDARQYRTWGAFLSDFRLMLRNAFYFNDKKSYVYRVALLLNKEGNERLKEVDVEGRQAIYLMHPGGPAAAAEDEAREFEERQLPVPMNPFLIIPSEAPKATKSPLDVDAEMDQWEEDAYSSFSETESEGEERGQGCPSVMKMQSMLNVNIPFHLCLGDWM